MKILYHFEVYMDREVHRFISHSIFEFLQKSTVDVKIPVLYVQTRISYQVAMR